MSLKKMTQNKHSSAERSWFAKKMISGDITNEQYSIYLKQQYLCYSALEKRFENIEDENYCLPNKLKRAEKILEDLNELYPEHNKIDVFESTKLYEKYILEDCDETLLYAHVYVRYLGDLKGGQMIAKRVPGSGKYYQFENPEELEVFIRAKLNTEEKFKNECNQCFQSAINLFQDLQAHFEE